MDENREPRSISGMTIGLIAEYLEVKPDLVRLWWKRRQDGKLGVPEIFPDPTYTEGKLQLWAVEDIVRFGELYRKHVPQRGRPPAKSKQGQ